MFDQIPLHEAKLGQYLLMPIDGSVCILDSDSALKAIPKIAFQLQVDGYELPIVMEDEQEAMFYFHRN